jgi:hypothetical protein
MLKLAVDERVTIREAEAGDIGPIAKDMRASDCIEIAATALMRPADALTYSLENSSMCWTGLYDGVPVAMWGVVPGFIMPPTGMIWMLGTPTLEKLPFLWLRVCPETIRDMFERYERLLNYVDQRDKKTLRWAKWLGFELGEPTEYGPLRRQFVPITMEREKCAFRF